MNCGMNDFIEIYDNGEQWPNSVIEAITWFINNCSTTKSKESGLSYFNKNRKRICNSMTLDFGQNYEPNDIIYYLLNQAKTEYVNTYSFLKKLDWRLCPLYNLQGYDGSEEGYFSLHNEHTGMYPYRMLAWMIYLNDAVSGTEFPYQNKTITPKTGRTVIWPAGWTHPHKGVIPNEGLKYIATGWFYFLPKGEPKFDGRHPDEDKQEIVV